MTFFDLTLHTRSSLAVEGEPSDFISDYTGEVIGTGEDSAETIAGYVRAQVIHTGLAGDRGEPLFEVCDSPPKPLGNRWEMACPRQPIM